MDQSVVSKHPCSSLMLSAVHCLMSLLILSDRFTTGRYAGASKGGQQNQEGAGGRLYMLLTLIHSIYPVSFLNGWDS